MLEEMPDGRLVDESGNPATLADPVCSRCGELRDGIAVIVTRMPAAG
jgi:hypothetical protein